MKKLLVLLAMLFAMNASGQWVQISNPGTYTMSLAISGANLFAGTYDNYISPHGAVSISTNYGTSWSQTALNDNIVYSLLVSGPNLFAGVYGGVYLSTNNGSSWTAVNNGISNYYITNLAISGTNLFAGGYQPGLVCEIFLSTNSGTNWTSVSSGLPYSHVNTIAVSGTNIFAGFSYDSGIRLTTNYGTNWIAVNNGLTGLTVKSIAVIGTKLFATSFNYSNNSGCGVFMSINNGTNWTSVNNNLPNLKVNTLAISGTYLIAGCDSGVYISSNYGGNWSNINLGFPYGTSVAMLYTTNNYLFATTTTQLNNNLWRRPISEILGVNNINTQSPSKYSLSQNYPNPFNPVTIIRFSIPAVDSRLRGNDRVLLKVYDILGKEVQTLVNESLQPGTYETSFDGSSLTSGVYFYKLITNEFTETKKMLLIK